MGTKNVQKEIHKLHCHEKPETETLRSKHTGSHWFAYVFRLALSVCAADV